MITYLFILTLLLASGLLLALMYATGLLNRERAKVERGAMREEEQRLRIGILAQKWDDLFADLQTSISRGNSIADELKSLQSERDGLQIEIEKHLHTIDELREKVNDLQAMNTVLSSAEPEAKPAPTRTTRRKTSSANGHNA